MRDLVRDNRNGKVSTLRVVIRRRATQDDDSHNRGDSGFYTAGEGGETSESNKKPRQSYSVLTVVHKRINLDALGVTSV